MKEARGVGGREGGMGEGERERGGGEGGGGGGAEGGVRTNPEQTFHSPLPPTYQYSKVEGSNMYVGGGTWGEGGSVEVDIQVRLKAERRYQR